VKSIDQSTINREPTLTFFKAYRPAIQLKSIWKHFSLWPKYSFNICLIF